MIFQFTSKSRQLKLIDHIVRYTQVVNEPGHISGFQTDNVYVKHVLLEEFHTKAIVQNVYFFDLDAVTVVKRS